MDRHILVVDDEVNILNALERLLEEEEGFIVHRANCGLEGMAIMDANPQIGVVLSDQRMPNMTGTEFLKQVKAKHHKVVRMILSGYSELASITQAINEGSIFKFLTKPWDEDLLLAAIRESFDYYELSEQNRRLTAQLTQTNEKLAELNATLVQKVEDKTHRLQLHVASLKVYQDTIEHFPFAVLGLDDSSVVLENQAARALYSANQISLLGLPSSEAFKGEWSPLLDELDRFEKMVDLTQSQFEINDHIVTAVKMNSESQSPGRMLVARPI